MDSGFWGWHLELSNVFGFLLNCLILVNLGDLLDFGFSFCGLIAFSLLGVVSCLLCWFSWLLIFGFVSFLWTLGLLALVCLCLGDFVFLQFAVFLRSWVFSSLAIWELAFC